MIQEKLQLSERAIVEKLKDLSRSYSPLEIKSIEPVVAKATGYQPDVEITLAWRGRRVRFLAEVKARTAPKAIRESLAQMKLAADRSNRNLLLVVPYLSSNIVDMLNRTGLSGLDLNGNYLIETANMVAVRLDQKNRFPDSQPIKKIFSGNSSIVGRLFLTRKHFASVNEIHASIEPLGGSLSLSAVSKVLKGLEDELIIEKSRRSIVLIQPEKLLERLEEAYRPPRVSVILKLKLPATGFGAVEMLANWLPPPVRWVLSGESSAEHYAITTPSAVYTLYATDLASLEQYEDDRFFNLTVRKTTDSFPYFDSRDGGGIRWSSPVQCDLELAKMGKREQELAASVRESIMENLR